MTPTATPLTLDALRDLAAMHQLVDAERVVELLATAEARAAERHADFVRGAKVAHELTQETQTAEDYAVDLVRLVKKARMERDEASDGATIRRMEIDSLRKQLETAEARAVAAEAVLDDALAQRDACGAESIALRAALDRYAKSDRGNVGAAHANACAVLAAPSPSAEVMARRDEKTRAEERQALYGGLAMAFGVDALDSVGSSVVEKIRTKVRAAALEEALAKMLPILAVDADGEARWRDILGLPVAPPKHAVSRQLHKWVDGKCELCGAGPGAPSLTHCGYASPHPAPAPTVAPAAGEAKCCETCGGVLVERVVLAGAEHRAELFCPDCPQCAPEKGGAR